MKEDIIVCDRNIAFSDFQLNLDGNILTISPGYYSKDGQEVYRTTKPTTLTLHADKKSIIFLTETGFKLNDSAEVTGFIDFLGWGTLDDFTIKKFV